MSSSVQPGPKDPSVAPPAFERRRAVSPSAPLRGWLVEAAAMGKLVRLPVLIALEPHGPIRRTGARVGAKPDALTIDLDDTRLGVALQDRLRGKYQRGDATVAAWLQGEWQDATATLAITRFDGVIAAADLNAADHAEVER